MSQPDLFETPARILARRGNPATSHAAAARVKEFASKHQAQILAALDKHPAGLTVHEIAAFCQIDAHAVGKRMNELQRDGRVYVRPGNSGGEMTRTSPSGRQARVWGSMP